MRQVLGHVGGDVGLVARAELRGDLGHAPASIHQLQDGAAGVVEGHGAFGVEQHRPLPRLVVVEPGQPPEPGHVVERDRHPHSSRYALWMVSIMAHSISSLNASASNTLCWRSGVVAHSRTMRSPWLTSRGACTRRLLK